MNPRARGEEHPQPKAVWISLVVGGRQPDGWRGQPYRAGKAEVGTLQGCTGPHGSGGSKSREEEAGVKEWEGKVGGPTYRAMQGKSGARTRRKEQANPVKDCGRRRLGEGKGKTAQAPLM